MRVVIDGRFIRDDDTAAALVHHVLQSWRPEDRFDEIHLVLEPGTDLEVPDSVRIHSLRVPTSAFGRVARRRRLPRLCRRMGAEVLLTFAPPQDMARHRFPHVVLVQALPAARDVKGFGAVDATVCLSERIKQELLAYSPQLTNRPCWVIAPPSEASLEPTAARTLAVNESLQGESSPQLTLVDDALALELYAWHEVAGRLRLALVDTVARASWQAHQFKLPDLVPVATPVVVALSAGVRSARHAPGRAAAGRRHASISGRAVVVGGLGALAISAVSAASVVIATAPPASAPAHHVVTGSTSTGATATNPTTPVRSDPTPTTSAPATTATSSSSTTTTTMLPVIVLPKSASLPSVEPTSLLPTGLPTVTVPSISIPSLPLPISLCPGATTTTTTTTTTKLGITVPSLCNLSLTGLLGLKTP